MDQKQKAVPQDSLALEELKKMTKEELISLVFYRCGDDLAVQAHRQYGNEEEPPSK